MANGQSKRGEGTLKADKKKDEKADKKKITGGGFEWELQEMRGGNQWLAIVEKGVPPRIKQLDEKTFTCYRDGKYLGCEGNLETAFARVEVNTLSERNREIEWQRTHPDEIPLGLRLTEAERAAWWIANPPRAVPAPKIMPPKPIPPAPRAMPPTQQPPVTGGHVEPDKVVEPVQKPERKRRASAADVVALLERKEGCTREDILSATGWPSVSVQAVAKTAGLTLRVDKSSKPFRYYAEGKSTK